MGPAGVIALLAGWFTTEIGRQPWVVYGVMRTAHAVSPHGTMEMGISLALFVLVYCAVFGVGASYVFRLIREGPVPHEGERPRPGGAGRRHTPARPLSAPSDAVGDASSPPLRG